MKKIYSNYKSIENTIRFATVEDTAWFDRTLRRVIDEDFGEKMGENVSAPRYFVDFLR